MGENQVNFLELGVSTFWDKLLRLDRVIYLDDEDLVAKRFFNEAGIKYWFNKNTFYNKENKMYLVMVSFPVKHRDRVLDEIMPKVDNALLLKHSNYYSYRSEVFPQIIDSLVSEALASIQE